jgi:putative transposase
MDVVEVMEALKQQNRAVPKRIQVDNGSEFISKDFDRWAYDNKVVLDYSRPGKPTDNPFIESFNGSFRDECLNVNWFLSLDDAYEKINEWVNEYNSFRPHSSLNEMTPAEFVNIYWIEEKKKKALPGAPVDEHMYFAHAEHDPAASENTHVHQQNYMSSKGPKSTN